MSITASPTTLRGVVAPLSTDHSCKVALIVGDDEYPILPKGAGIDLLDMVSLQLEVICTIQEEDVNRYLHVRSYTILESDDDWMDDE